MEAVSFTLLSKFYDGIILNFLKFHNPDKQRFICIIYHMYEIINLNSTSTTVITQHLFHSFDTNIVNAFHTFSCCFMIIKPV